MEKFDKNRFWSRWNRATLSTIWRGPADEHDVLLTDEWCSRRGGKHIVDVDHLFYIFSADARLWFANCAPLPPHVCPNLSHDFACWVLQSLEDSFSGYHGWINIGKFHGALSGSQELFCGSTIKSLPPVWQKIKWRGQRGEEMMMVDAKKRYVDTLIFCIYIWFCACSWHVFRHVVGRVIHQSIAIPIILARWSAFSHFFCLLQQWQAKSQLWSGKLCGRPSIICPNGY